MLFGGKLHNKVWRDIKDQITAQFDILAPDLESFMTNNANGGDW